MPKKKLTFDNWVLEKKDGTLARFGSYSDAGNAKRANPDLYSQTADIRFAPNTP